MPRPLITTAIAFAITAALALVSPSASARVVPGDAFLCAEARSARAPREAPPLPTFHARVGVTVIDRFTRPLPSERYTLDLKKPKAFCHPVRIDDEDLTDPLHGLEVYEARRTHRKPAPPPLPVVTETVESVFGLLELRVGSVETLDVPTLATGSVGGSGPERDHFACYQVKPERGAALGRSALRIAVRTNGASRMVEIRKPVRLCVPASVRGEDPSAPKHPVDLVCFAARLARDDVAAENELLSTRNTFGNEVLKLGAARSLCVPAARLDVAVPTPTPFPTITPPPTPVPTVTPVKTPRPPSVRVEPASTTALVHDRACFAAILELPDGTPLNVTATALWRVVDGTVAVPAGFQDGKKCFIGVGIGSTDLTARDAGTNVVSPPARFKAEWPIFKLTVSPKQLGLRPGQSETLTVTATLVGERVRNVTQHVHYEVLDESVASTPNASGNRSRVDGVGTGRTSVIVRDALSSLYDATTVAVGALRSVSVDTPPPIFPGEHASLQVTGIFDGGFTSNLTQIASYESSDPGVVVAANAPGDRGRVEGVQPGLAVVTAVDPLSGIRSQCCGTVSVLGDLSSLTVTPANLAYRKGVGGDSLLLKAFGIFAIPPGGEAGRIVSDRVTWSTNPPGVVNLGGLVNDRQQLGVIAGGETQVVATDLASGVTAAATVTIYDHLDRIEVGDSRNDPSALEERNIVIGGAAHYFAHGYFDGGRYALIDSAQFVASDPTVVRFFDGWAYGFRPGTVVVSAVDGTSGVTSDDPGGRSAILHVFGDIVRLVLTPPTTTLEVGQARTLTTVAHHAGGGTESATQQVVYTSSDPTVVVAPNDFGNRSRIVAVGPGTATISARDLDTGVTSTASGDDTVVTVLPVDSLVRLVLSPTTRRVAVGATTRFAAVGTFAGGITRNYTQKVDWTSDGPAIAVATNVVGDRSRVDTFAPGTVGISVRDPVSGLTSTDTGDDATLTVEALAALTLTPETLELTAGASSFLTTVGEVTGADSFNLTQDVVYVSSDPDVVQATNEPGNKSRIVAVAPGVATITAFRASTYPQATDSNSITVTVSP